jgi:phosphatidate cytidylyltransferase
MIGITVVILVVDQWTAPWFPFWLVLASLAMGLAARELVDLLRDASIAPAGNIVVGGVLALVASNWVAHITCHLLRDEKLSQIITPPHDPLAAFAWTFITFVGVLMGCFLDQATRFEQPGRTVATIAGTIFAIAYIGLLGSFTIQMRWLDGRGEGLLPLVYLIATAKGSDIGAYLVGRIAGRHKLWPRLSPNKTIEGALGGLALGVAASLLITRLARSNFELAALEPGAAVLFGLIVGVAAQIGDLMESLIKRDCEQKDASNAVPGFGGVLDVLDSLLFAGPVAYIFWLWVGP